MSEDQQEQQQQQQEQEQPVEEIDIPSKPPSPSYHFGFEDSMVPYDQQLLTCGDSTSQEQYAEIIFSESENEITETKLNSDATLQPNNKCKKGQDDQKLKKKERSSSGKKSLSRQMKEIEEQAMMEAKHAELNKMAFTRQNNKRKSTEETSARIVLWNKKNVGKLTRKSSQQNKKRKITELTQEPIRFSQSSSEKIGKMAISSDLKVIKKSDLFDGFIFTITRLQVEEKEELSNEIRANGGIFLETREILQDMHEREKIIMLSKECSTTIGYLAALAIDIPLLKVSWFKECIAEKRIILPREDHQLPCFVDSNSTPPVQTLQELPYTLEEFLHSYCFSNELSSRLFYKKKVYIDFENGSAEKVKDIADLLRFCGAKIVSREASDIDFILCNKNNMKHRMFNNTTNARLINVDYIKRCILEQTLLNDDNLPAVSNVEDESVVSEDEKKTFSTPEKALPKNLSHSSSSVRLHGSITPIGSQNQLAHISYSGLRFKRNMVDTIHESDYYHLVLHDGRFVDARVDKIFRAISDDSPIMLVLTILQGIEQFSNKCRVLAPTTINIKAEEISWFCSLHVQEITVGKAKKLKYDDEKPGVYLVIFP
jgi:hypothetical protein